MQKDKKKGASELDEVAKSFFPSACQSLAPDVSDNPHIVPISIEPEPDANGNDSMRTGELETFQDLFMAAHEQQAPPETSLDEESSEDTDTDSTSSSDAGSSYTYGLRFDQYNPKSGRSDYFPWTSLSMFLADQLMNSRRLKFTRRQMRAVLAYARETGGRDIPSYKALRKAQAKMRNILGNPTARKVSCLGNVFYMNRITGGLAQDMANPLLRKHMSFYPHYNNNRMSQIWHGGKLLKDVPDRVLTPMIRHNNRIYYVGELVERTQGWFLPLRWILYGKERKMYAAGHIVKETQNGLHVCSNRRITVPVSSFLRSFPELSEENAVPLFNDESQRFRTSMPHPLRAVAGLRPVYSLPIILFMDDVSGNETNMWSKHISCYISNAALTREVLNAEYSVRFVLTSKHAGPSELLQGIREDLEDSFQNPVIAYDCENQEEILIRGYPALSAADNPMQAEQCSCQLQNANYFCRTCGAGGSAEFKQSEIGYESLLKPGEKRTPCQTQERINALLEMSIYPGQKTRIKEQARDWGIRDSRGQLVIEKMLDMGQKLREENNRVNRRSEGDIIASLKAELDFARQQGSMNSFLDMKELGFNVHEDTPTEILHTILLGVVKYFWGQTVFVLTKTHQMSTLETRLGSLSLSGLNINSISERYMCQYTGSLVGKHFKNLAQLMPFACYDLVEPNLLEAWLLLGRLTVLLWFTEIDDIDVYIAEIQVIINDFLLAAARCSPSIIVLKPKFHFLVHLPMYIQRFGPAILFSTERFESFHGVFRAGSVHSNRRAPSRDIAEYFVGLDRLKHICSGGYWREGSSWVRASSFVREFMTKRNEFQTLLGLPVNLQEIICIVNLQHDCSVEGKCTLRSVAERQEREDTNRTRHVVQHSDSQRYILNTQGLHGIKHIRSALPPSLLEWRRLQVEPGTVIREAVQKLASAAVNKALQAEARKTAKESFRSVVESRTTAGTESELDQRSTKRKRTKSSKPTPSSVNHTDAPVPTPSLQPVNRTAVASAESSTSRIQPESTVDSAPTSYSDFWAQFRRAS
ncbi:hypothetical protein RSOL_420510, partial [Rhizoctonia solani AG-3 Rhs1AP]